MAKRLATRNIETITAFSASEGLEKLETHQNLDVIVLDVKMPGMDGLEMLKKIKTGLFRQRSLCYRPRHGESGIAGMNWGLTIFYQTV